MRRLPPVPFLENANFVQTLQFDQGFELAEATKGNPLHFAGWKALDGFLGEQYLAQRDGERNGVGTIKQRCKKEYNMKLESTDVFSN